MSRSGYAFLNDLINIDEFSANYGWDYIWEKLKKDHNMGFTSSQLRKDGKRFPVKTQMYHYASGNTEIAVVMYKQLKVQYSDTDELSSMDDDNRFRLIAATSTDTIMYLDRDLTIKYCLDTLNRRIRFARQNMDCFF